MRGPDYPWKFWSIAWLLILGFFRSNHGQWSSCSLKTNFNFNHSDATWKSTRVIIDNYTNLFNRLYCSNIKENIVNTGPPVAGGLPSQRVIYGGNVSMSWWPASDLYREINQLQSHIQGSICVYVHPKDTPTGELWGLFCEYLWDNLPRYNGIALHFVLCSSCFYTNNLALAK